MTIQPAEIVGLDDPRWRRFVAESPDALPFHEPAWATLLSDCYGFPAFVLASIGAAGEIEAGIPVLEVRKPLRMHRWIALPFTDHCPPLVADPSQLSRFSEQLDAARNEAGVAQLEVRDHLKGDLAESFGNAVEHTLDLDADAGRIFDTFKRPQIRKQITHAEREGVTVRRAEALSDLIRTYYRIHVETRRRLGVPAQPRRFFHLLWERFLERDLGFALLAYVGNTPVAGAVFLTSATTTTYKFGASDPSFWKSHPNHLVFWSAIRWSCEHGRTTFDFGRTELEHQGLRRFKQGWGTRETPLLYSTLGAPVDEHSKGIAGRTAAGVIQHSPSWVCRAVGTALYRYAA